MNNNVERSTFVSVVAWIFISLSGFATLIAILQNIIIQTVFTQPEVHQAIQNQPPGIPPFAAFMFNHMTFFPLFFLIVTSITLIVSIGLLMRKNWARLCFIGIMFFAILWNLVGLVMQVFMFHFMKEQFATGPGMPDMSIVLVAVTVISVIFTIGFSILFGWIARTLMSRKIVVEFGR